MYIRMLNFQTDGDKKAELITIMKTIIPKIRAKKGCEDCKFITHDSDNRYALLVFWDSKENADGAADIIGPQLLPALNNIAKEPVMPRLYEVSQDV
jgi:hypothetical protein